MQGSLRHGVKEKEAQKGHTGNLFSKLIFNQYNRYKPILNQYLTDITDTLPK